MLIKLHSAVESGHDIQIEKMTAERDVSRLGAFECGETILHRVTLSRRWGVSAVVLRICRDGEKDQDLPLSFVERRETDDVYELTLDTEALCAGEKHGLFYYTYLFVRGLESFFTESTNNVDFIRSDTDSGRFRMLVYEKDYTTPAWFPGGTMYHIFLDRFCRGEGKAELHADALLDPDWQHGIPQYARRAGDPLSNNVFFGGNLWGVIEKLDHLSSLGVTVLYLSPIFKAYSNHRYDTGDYETVDPLLGGGEAFDALIREAHARGMRVILDGVFNHTGDDSRYFNRKGTYPGVGAYQSKESPYYNWFSFRSFPDEYECWWNIDIMPRLQHERASCRYYFTGPGGICERWLRRGADGWRLDVADELPNDFLDELRTRVKETTNGEGLIIGEVWENAVEKVAYGFRRRYFSGGQLDSVMNYPFRNAALAFVGQRDAETFYNILTELYGSYPTSVCHSLMNLLGTHDTDRILTLLGDEGQGEGLSNDQLAYLRLTPTQKTAAIRRLKVASTLQFTVFGVPSVYYGDEAGVEGYHDPFCRMPFPWGREDADLGEHYRSLGALRRRSSALKNGEFRFTFVKKDALAYERVSEEQHLLVIANMSTASFKHTLTGAWRNALTGEDVPQKLVLERESCVVLEKI